MTDLAHEIRTLRGLPSPELRRMIRRSAGVSMRRLAKEVGVDHSTISRWESGAGRPRGEAGLRYADILKSLQHELAGA